MARKQDKKRVLAMRKQGMSYSQIKGKVKISKSTLSVWLKDLPLGEKRIQELRDNSPVRIEKFRNTMRVKKETRLTEVYKKVAHDICDLSKRDLFLAGLFLYWGEGTKSQNSLVALTNTNPAMIKFFINWLKLFGVENKDLKIKLHLYSDMKIKESLDFWSKELTIPISQFYKPYIKKNTLKSISYKNGFGKGTCSVIFGDRDLWEYITMALKYITEVSNENFRP
jgi:hypothetical protein